MSLDAYFRHVVLAIAWQFAIGLLAVVGAAALLVGLAYGIAWIRGVAARRFRRAEAIELRLVVARRLERRWLPRFLFYWRLRVWRPSRSRRGRDGGGMRSRDEGRD